jgi:hypothetical protein
MAKVPIEEMNPKSLDKIVGKQNSTCHYDFGIYKKGNEKQDTNKLSRKEGGMLHYAQFE